MATDVLSGISTGWASGFNILAKIGTIVIYVLIFGVVVAVLLYVLKFKYPLTLIFETAGGGKRFVKDRGHKDKKNNKFKALKNKDVTFPYPKSEHEYIHGKKTGYIAVIRDQSASFLTITPNPHFVAANYDMREKLINDFKNSWSILKPKEKFWDKYGAQVLWVGSMGIFLIIIILILQRLDALIGLGNNVAAAQISANKQVIESVPFLLWALKNEK